MWRVAALPALAAVLAGCPGARDPADAMRCGPVTTVELAPCPSPGALAAHLRDRWALPAAATITTACTPGRFAGAAGWLVRAAVERDGDAAAATFVLQPSCSALTDATLRDEPPGDDRHETIDLDGDGSDEIVVRKSAVEDAGTSTSIEVLRVGTGRFVRAGKVRIAYRGRDPAQPAAGTVTCDGTVRYLARPERGFYVEIDAVRSADSSLCLATGRHRFELASRGLRPL